MTQACKRAHILEQRNYQNLTENEMQAFQVEIAAGLSNKGFFKAWFKQQSYTEYATYAASKHLVEKGKRFTISK
ncbi:MAG: hypothetical protein JSS07_11750 [Proteobacteria bacterium]|nr:hypothetical protein [Pseudomonadota bacterium]